LRDNDLFGIVANGTALTFPSSANVNPRPGNKNFWFTGWVVQRKIKDKLVFGVELFHHTPDKGRCWALIVAP
jgi:hypothetical protein